MGVFADLERMRMTEKKKYPCQKRMSMKDLYELDDCCDYCRTPCTCLESDEFDHPECPRCSLYYDPVPVYETVTLGKKYKWNESSRAWEINDGN